jgi:hypothetical protein
MRVDSGAVAVLVASAKEAFFGLANWVIIRGAEAQCKGRVMMIRCDCLLTVDGFC